MNNERIAIKQKLKDDLVHYASRCLKIRTKAGAIEPFILNRSQLYAHKKIEEQRGRLGYVRAVILKARQQGLSTYIGGRFYHRVSWNKGMQAFILAHESKATDNLYEMVHRYHEHTDPSVKPQVSKSNAKQLVFGLLDSGYKLGTSENKDVGRSSTIQLLHWSEVAFSSHTDHHVKGVLQAVPLMSGTEIILESTANGVGGFFHNEWQKAEAALSDYIAIFIPWFWQDEYSRIPGLDFNPTPAEDELRQQYDLTLGQLSWRRSKIVELSVNGIDGEKAFLQEYPSNPNEAFQLTGEDSYIDSNTVVSARHAICERYGPLLLGVDPARFGDDRTSIIFRQGRVAFNLKSYIKKDTMEIAGIVYQLIKEHAPSRVFVDVGGLGAGVVDRLVELVGRDIIVAVNAGSAPLDANRYRNKKSEMWATMKQWLTEEPVQIPDSDSLHADLCGVKYKFDSNTRLVMESKEEMKKRGLRSSDEADALCLTFALPDSALLANKSTDDVLNSLTESFDKRMAAVGKSRR